MRRASADRTLLGARALVAAGLLLAALLLSCGGDPRFENLTELQRRGLQVYVKECKVCHSMNARSNGPLGPDIAGASKELLEARILRLAYPDGYTPKRDTRQMFPPKPHLAGEIDALHAFLSPALHPKPNEE